MILLEAPPSTTEQPYAISPWRNRALSGGFSSPKSRFMASAAAFSVCEGRGPARHQYALRAERPTTSALHTATGRDRCARNGGPAPPPSGVMSKRCSIPEGVLPERSGGGRWAAMAPRRERRRGGQPACALFRLHPLQGRRDWTAPARRGRSTCAPTQSPRG